MPTPSAPFYPENSTPSTKICVYGTCPFKGEPQPLSVFCKSSHSSDGLSTWCATCRTSYRKNTWEKLKNNPDELALRKQRRQVFYWETRDERNAKRRADKAKERESRGNPPRKNKTSREAINERWEKWKADNPEFAKRKKPQRQNGKAEYNGWARKAVYRSKHRAAERNIAFNIEEADLNDHQTGKLPVFCSILTHIRLDYSGGPDKRKWASVDRIEPKLGYAKGNVRVISMAANMAKNDGDGDLITRSSITN